MHESNGDELFEQGRKPRLPLFSLLWRACGPIVLVALLIGIANGLANATMIALIRRGIQANGSAKGLAITFGALCIGVPVMRTICLSLMLHLAHKSTHRIVLQLGQSILAAPLRKLEEIGTAKLMAALTDDVGLVSGGVIGSLGLVLNGAVLVGCVAFLGWVSWQGLLGLVLLTTCVLTTYHFISTTAATKAMRAGQVVRNSLFGYYRALIYGTKELKLHSSRRNAFISEGMAPTAELYERHDMFANIVYFGAGAWSDLLMFAGLGVIIFVLPGIQVFSMATASAFAMVLLYVMSPLATMVSAFPRIGHARVALEGLRNLGLSLAGAGAEPDGRKETWVVPDWSNLELRAVTMSYRGEADGSRSFVLGPIDVTFRRGRIVFIMGGNGSGKTTLGKLLLGLYPPDSGEIRLDDETIGFDRTEQYRNLFSAIFPDFYLFDSLLGLHGKDLEQRASDYLKRLRLDGRVKIENGVLSTTKLSQGQRKRLALLSAYLEDRPIYVFDEWAADQEPRFKEFFYMTLLPELKADGKTVFVITHDETYEQAADRIIRLEDGKIQEDCAALQVEPPSSRWVPVEE